METIISWTGNKEREADVKFLYGLSPAVSMEIFVSHHFAFTVAAALPVNFSSPISNVHYEAGLGFKVLM